MSYLKKNVAYVIIPTISISEEMINNAKSSFYSTKSSLRTSIDGTKTLFKIKQPISSVFDGYEWYNQEDIKIYLNDTANGFEV